MEGPDRPKQASLERLGRLLDLAERVGLYLDLTGLGCYHKPDVPAWYDRLAEPERWAAQGHFWEAIARRCASSPAVFCYDLMNEPVVPGGKGQERSYVFRGLPRLRGIFTNHFSSDGRRITSASNVLISSGVSFTPVA
jgi:hypothetical protein